MPSPMYQIFLKDVRDLKATDILPERLTAGRLARLQKLASEQDRRRCAAAGLLLWEHLYRRRPENYTVTYNRWGKPAVVSNDGSGPIPFFNLSHSGDLTVLALSDRPVGCDIESHQRSIPGRDALAERLFHPRELELLSLARTSPQKADSCFFRLWTAREAYLKACGTGFAAQTRDIDLSPGRLTDSRGRRWQIDTFQPQGYPDYTLSVCFLQPDPL